MTTFFPAARPASHDYIIDLRGIVRINEEIRRVIGVAFRINIMALNAIFLAKRAGSSATGFSVLSHELRAFSQSLREHMQTLTGLVHDCVVEVSRLLRRQRHVGLVRQAVELSMAQGCGPALAGRIGDVEEERGEHLAWLRKQLLRALEDAFRLVELGGVLAKSAKIEAAYGQGFAASLSQVSSEFDGVVEEIRSSLESLRKSSFFVSVGR